MQQFILTAVFAVFASQASAMFIQADWFDPSGNTAVSPEEAEQAEREQAEREERQDSVRETGSSGLIGNGVKAIADSAEMKAAERALRYARQRAVVDVWKMERQLAVKGLPTARPWSADQLTELIDTGRVKGVVGDHINTVNGNKSLAANHGNIQFSTVAEHDARHAAAGGFRTQISGQPMIDSTLGGQLPDLATPTARGWPERARGLGIMGFSGVAAGLEAMEQFDPIFGPNAFFGASPMGCGTLDC